MQDELDKNLQALFQEKRRRLPEEPFLGNMLRIIQRRQSRRIFIQRLLWILVFAYCAGLSPFLIKGSVLVSIGLNAFIGKAGAFMATPIGMGTAAFGLLLLGIFKRRWISQFV